MIKHISQTFRNYRVFIAIMISMWIACSFANLKLLAQEKPALEISISGTVFHDANKNGKLDDGETGIRGVVVSDQVIVATSNPEGVFRMDRAGGYGIVFVSVPEGYRAIGPIWRSITEHDDQARVDFPLAKLSPAKEFTFIHASDTHISEKSLPRMRMLRQLVEKHKPAFILVTGDLVRDALRAKEDEASGYYDLYMREIEVFPVPVWSVPGNHEIFGIERHRSLVSPEHPLYGKKMYRHYLGPNYYSFNFGGVHFIGLDTADFDDLWYYGHIDSTQIAWLERDIANVPKDMPVVTFNHIPFYTSEISIWGYDENPPAPTLITVNGKKQFRHVVSNAGDLLALLGNHNYTLALGGHNHVFEQLVFATTGRAPRFHQTAAIVGPTKTGGIQMQSGVTIYRVRNGKIDNGEFVPLHGE